MGKKTEDIFGGKVPDSIRTYQAASNFFDVVSDERARQFEKVLLPVGPNDTTITRDSIVCTASHGAIRTILDKFGPRPHINIIESSEVCNELQAKYSTVDGAPIYWGVEYIDDDPVIHPSTTAVICNIISTNEYTFPQNLRKIDIVTRSFNGFSTLLPNLESLRVTTPHVSPKVNVALFAPNLRELYVSRYDMITPAAICVSGLSSLKELTLDGVNIAGKPSSKLDTVIYFPYKWAAKSLKDIQSHSLVLRVSRISPAMLLALPHVNRMTVHYDSAAKGDYKAIAPRCSPAVRAWFAKLFE